MAPSSILEGSKILLVDDTPQNLKILRAALQPEGYSLLIATNGEGALRIARSAIPDLILLDVQMPGMDGFETCRRLKADPETEHIPIIFVTAMAETDFVVEGFRAGGVDYIVKPYQNEEVLVRVATHLKIDHLARDLETANAALQESNTRVREAADRKLQFIASLSHEFRTPLTAIKGSVDNLSEGIAGPVTDRHRRYFDRISENSDFMTDLIDDILDISKIEAGKLEVSLGPVDVPEVLASCCDAVRDMLGEGVALNLVIPESDRVTEVVTDGSRLKQIVLNLLSNAVKFTSSGGVTLEVDARVEDGREWLVIEVADTGIGIPEDALETIFEEFRQAGGTKGKYKGTGLGLSITRKLTELLGGEIAVESDVGVGSTFRVRLPAERVTAHA